MHKRAELVAPGQPLHLVTSPIADPAPGCVRVKLAFSGVCHSDVHLLDDQFKICETFGEDKFRGMVLGHEMAGYLDKVGDGVDLADFNLKVGDCVMVYPWVGCQKCSTCKAGFTNVCPDPLAGAVCIGCGPFADGGYQSHLETKPQFLLKVPDSIPLEVACMLPCSAGTSYASLQKLQEAFDFGKVVTGKARLLIIGSGGLGLWAMQLAKAMHGEKVHIVAADIDQSKLDLAKTFGADEMVLWDPSATVEANAEATIKNGPVNGAIDYCATTVTSQTAVKCLIRHGALVFVGLRGGIFSSNFYEIIVQSITIRGNCAFSFNQFREVVDLVDKHKLAYPCLEFYRLEKVYDVIQKLKKGEINGRAIIKHEA